MGRWRNDRLAVGNAADANVQEAADQSAKDKNRDGKYHDSCSRRLNAKEIHLLLDQAYSRSGVS